LGPNGRSPFINSKKLGAGVDDLEDAYIALLTLAVLYVQMNQKSKTGFLPLASSFLVGSIGNPFIFWHMRLKNKHMERDRLKNNLPKSAIRVLRPVPSRARIAERRSSHFAQRVVGEFRKIITQAMKPTKMLAHV
jgi:hypothetical protein